MYWSFCLRSESNTSSLNKVTISRDDTLILHGGGDKKLIEERCEEVHMVVSYTMSTMNLDHSNTGTSILFCTHIVQLRSANEKSTSTFDKEKTQERLSKLSGGVAVFKVSQSVTHQSLFFWNSYMAK